MEWTEPLNTILDDVIKLVNLRKDQVKKVIELSEDSNTVPFIARYRKEMTGGLDEEQIRHVLDSWGYANQLADRKAEVVRLIAEQEKLTPELEQKITSAVKLQQVEDLYRPYKQKRRTRATVAKEKGLEPLARWIMSYPGEGIPEQEAENYINEESEVLTAEDAIQGALDIVSETLADDPDIRQHVRDMTFKDGAMISSVKPKAEDEKGVFEMYYDYQEPVKSLAHHRVLAMNRGESENVLKVKIKAPEDRILGWMTRHILKGKSTVVTDLMERSIEDSYSRLIEPAVEREIRREVSEKAEEQAIHIFGENLRSLLLQPPLKDRVILGMDPAYRTGCKLAVIDATGKLLEVAVIYPVKPWGKVTESRKKVQELIERHGIDLIAIGNGTASRETEQFTADLLRESGLDVPFLIVNEAGASVYSASKLAKEEFPDLQVEERSAASISRRVQDPLAELVKIDPKSVGVGQYQHDVTQSRLNESLSFVVETVVNRVGVNVNTASSSLLVHVSGLSKAVANNIVNMRDEQGKFTSRTQLKKVPRLGAKTYEQSIGFMRIPDGKEVLDQTGIHPESYPVAKKLMKDYNITSDGLGTDEVRDLVHSLSVEELAGAYETGVPTIRDILQALAEPGRDPRDELSKPILKTDVLKMEDLSKGMELEGTVRNVVDFGAFVDIGVKQDGLVHISKLRKGFVKNPMDVVNVGDVVTIWVEDVDVQKGRIALTMIKSDS
ncbi:Tex family protein [Salisediminibacterium beveridgei]|uniref:Transcription accessory protein (S1 RNA-binding domain) n=1 Tax=Salisediminibacterium beveridgei TaxID=632773 RepID=A0A1D7QYP9_9BACI|nr:Tex family protein [Salisediminibacterium beveridgei]AOM84127.1 Transcription accessory protein (S1 RNA-binding domain) [Salisediminibacterium beveridgei]